MKYLKATQNDIYEMFDDILCATDTDNLKDAISEAAKDKESLIDLLRDPRMGTGYDITWDLLVELVDEFVAQQTPSPFAEETA